MDRMIIDWISWFVIVSVLIIFFVVCLSTDEDR